MAGRESAFDVPFDGRIYRHRSGPIHGKDGSVVAGIAVAHEVTDERLTEVNLREERRRLHNAQAVGRIGSWELDIASGAIRWSKNLFDLYGVDPLGFAGDLDAVLRCIHPDDRELVDSAVAACATTGLPIHVRYRVTRADDGVLRWFDGRGERIDEAGIFNRIVGATVDVTEQVVAELEITAAHAFQRGLLSAVGQALIVTDPHGRITLWNPAAEAMYGWSESEALGQLVTSLIPSEESTEQANEIMDALRRGESWTGDFMSHRRDGSTFPTLVTDAPVYDDTGQLAAIIGVSSDMTDRDRLERELTRHAMYDALTGLPNRMLMTDRLEQALTASRRNAAPLSLMFIDIDQFKTVNDAAGHLVGDELLVGVANRLSGVARATDTVARFGGDEFV
ncbi:MAG: hypothetical protein JWM76_2996, partial [Pseudonocardiales bacterium]|nr:hypothetical protein [Pseudonocardiales bacterium]